MKATIVRYHRLLLVGSLLSGSLLAGCASGMGALKSPDMQFAAKSRFDGKFAIFHMNPLGIVTSETLDFIPESKYSMHWDLAGINHVAMVEDRLLGSHDDFQIDYYKNKILEKSVRISNPAAERVMWIKLLPEKNCLVVELWGRNESILVRIDLTDGSQITRNLRRAGYLGGTPVWDRGHNRLVIASRLSNVVDEKELFTTRLVGINPDDLSFETLAKVPEVNVRTLLSLDPDTGQITAYGEAAPRWRENGFYRIDPATGRATKIMDDDMPGYQYEGIAMIGGRYVIICRNGILLRGPGTFFVNLENQSWRETRWDIISPVSQESLFVAGQ